MDQGLAGSLLIDSSAWSHFNSTRLLQSTADAIADAFEAGRVHASLPFLLEAGYSARTGADHGDLLAQLGAIPFAEIDRTAEDLALVAQAELAKVGHHRLPPVDVMLGALATRHGLKILHYDSDFDVLAKMTSLRFESVWIAPRGSL